MNIPGGISKGCENIGSLFQDVPFGWIVRIFKNIIWDCFLWPIIKFILILLGMFIVFPLLFLIVTFITCLGKFIVGLIGAMSSSFIASPFPLIVGIIISAATTCGGSCNRFPKESDNGTYGLYIVENT